MKRRDALRRLGALSTAIVLSTNGLLSACSAKQKQRSSLSAKDVLLLDEIGETILPGVRDLPGAKAAAIGLYMLTTVNDCYSLQDKAIFIKGIDGLEHECQQRHGKSFVALEPEQKNALLSQMDKQARSESDHYFTLLRKLTIYGYVSSEPGATKALRYLPVPGQFKNIPYKKGDKRWATS
jgi:hypothetical protein